MIGPAIAIAIDLLQLPAARHLPTAATHIAQCSGDRSLQHGRGIVPGAVGRAVGLQPKRLFVSVVTGIPAVDRHVDTAAESQAIVDHDYLLEIGKAAWRERGGQYG